MSAAAAYRFDAEGHSLEDLVWHTLARNPYLSSRSIRTEMRGGEVVLKGAVRSYFQKQMAQESLREVAAGRIVNELEVIPC